MLAGLRAHTAGTRLWLCRSDACAATPCRIPPQLARRSLHAVGVQAATPWSTQPRVPGSAASMSAAAARARLRPWPAARPRLFSAAAAAAATDPYRALGVRPGASKKELKKAYREQAMKWHPDRNPDKREEAEKRFKTVTEAYNMLSGGGGSGGGGGGGGRGFGGGGGRPGGGGAAGQQQEWQQRGRQPSQREAEQMFNQVRHCLSRFFRRLTLGRLW